MFISLIRTLILYVLVLIIMRLMGKRQVGQLEPFDLVITIMISDLASIPMSDTKIPLLNGIIPIVTLLALEITLSLIQLKSRLARTVLTGRPSILISNGEINISKLKEQKYSLDDLFEEMRIKGYYDLKDVQYAILETSGKLSIFPKSELNPASKKDLNIKTVPETLPVSLINEGIINYSHLKLLNKDEKWLYSTLKSKHISDIRDVFLAVMDSSGKFFYQLQKGRGK
jgi:uncharacterized membrane protein YcaP (DUF421 family)